MRGPKRWAQPYPVYGISGETAISEASRLQIVRPNSDVLLVRTVFNTDGQKVHYKWNGVKAAVHVLSRLYRRPHA